jgi:cation:H+ antiporter
MVLAEVGVLAVGILLLTAGAEGLVKGAARLATVLKVSPVVVGLTIASFGTSMPEFVVSVLASARGDTAIAVGNVIGSNIFNILAVLGPAALLTPLVVKATVVRRDVPILIGVTLLFAGVAWTGMIGRVTGALFVLGILAYVTVSYRWSRDEALEVMDEYADEYARPGAGPTVWNVTLILGGILLLAVGGRLVVDAAVTLALALGVTERVIALTLVAGGTSLPELATTLVAVWRRHVDIAVGNLVGSGIFNVLAIAGAAALVHPLVIPRDAFLLEIPVMVLASLALVPILFTAHRVSRGEGVILVLGLITYLWLLVTGPFQVL